MMQRRRFLGRPAAIAALAVILSTVSASAAEPAQGEAAEAAEILRTSGVQGGLVVHFGCTDGQRIAALRAGDAYLVHGLALDADALEKARRHVRSLGLYGSVAVEPYRGGGLPYADNLVNLFVAEDLHGLSMDEVLRVLAPGGVACIRRDGEWTRTVKPRPTTIDDWPHALYDASNNAVSNDTVVASPHHLQWLAKPRNARHHESLASVSVVVSAGGRLFSIVDEATAASILLPPEWRLVARDAFNGMVLWKRPISPWHPHLHPFRSGPPELARRLVATADRVYVTLGLDAPVTALDAATGQTLMTYQGTEATEEILHCDGMLYLVVGSGTADEGQPSTPPESRTVMVIDAATGQVRWKRSDVRPLPMSLTVGDERLFWLAPDGVVCVDSQTGTERWRTERTVARRRPGWSAPTVVVVDDVLLCADRRATPVPDIDESTGKRMARWLAEGGGAGDLVAYSAKTGETLWTVKCAETYHAAIDVFVHDGLVWVGRSRARQGPDFNAALDLHTGEVKHRISPDKAFETTMPHHRCHRNRATARYLITGRTGVEFIDVTTGDALRHHWIRGVCQYGVVPANGLLYVPPHSCACYIEAKLTGFLALAPRPSFERNREQAAVADPLERGAAYEELASRDSEPGDPHDWPTYRHDGSRSACSPTAVPAELACAWEACPGGRLSSPVIADGRVLVASVDAHTIHAFDAKDGRPLWQYTAGGRIDSPPTLAAGRAVFGSVDGSVYCLRASDGQLAWRYRAAPEDRRLVATGQVESAWPVHGSVLVRGGSVYCAAGRSSYLDGGIWLTRLDLATGKKLAEKRLYSRDPRTGAQPGEPIMFEMPGALPDVLSSDGKLLYMRHLGLDPDDLEPREAQPHLYSPAGFLNDDWWHRTYWIYGEHFYSGYIGWYFAGRETPAGRLLLLDEGAIYGFAYRPEYFRGARERRYHLFAMDRASVPPQPPADYDRANRDYPHRGPGKFRMKFRWSEDVRVLVRAMVLADDTLFVAGPPSRALESKAAFDGALGAMLCAVSAADGEMLAEYRLDALPVFDGLAAAQGRLYLTTQDGRLLCLSDRRSTPKGRELPRLRSSKAPAGTPVEPDLVGHWRFDEGQGYLAADGSGRGYDAELNGRWAAGEFGTCVHTAGVPGAVTIRDSSLLQFGTSSFSLLFWLKPQAFDCRLLGKEDFPRNWWVVNLLGDGRAELVLGAGREPGQSVRPTSRTCLATDAWNHLAFVVDRTAGEVRCYVNGSLDSTTKLPAGFDGPLDVEGQDLRIPSSHKPFDGLFDELWIYRRALTESEVRAKFDDEKAKRTETAFRYLE